MGDDTSTIPSLTDLGNGGFPATEAAKYLVQALGRDVVSFQRNTHVSYMAAERARDILNQINEYIDKVEKSTSVDADWDTFEKFTTANDQLEDILFKLINFTKEEKGQHFANIGRIADCVTSAEKWACNRKELFEALCGSDTSIGLDKLADETLTPSRESERREAQLYDDKEFLKELKASIESIFSEDPKPKFPPHVQTAKDSLNVLQTEVIEGINGSTGSTPSPEWLRVIIQTSILVEGVVKIVKGATLSADFLIHLKSKPVWTAASELIEDLSNNKTQTDLPESVNEKYNEFIRLLQNSGPITLPEAYVKLIKKVGHIRRPFQAQAIALARLCHFLADKFNTTGASVSADNFNSLDEAFNKTLAVLEAAIGVVSDLRSFDTAKFDTHSSLQEFEAAEVLIKKGFESFSLDWSTKQSDLSAARTKDKKRMEELNSLYSQESNSTTKVMVHVKIHSEPGDVLLREVSVEEVETTRLLALRWRVAGVLTAQEDMKRAREAGTFSKDGKPLTLQSALADIRGGAGSSEVALKLVVPAPAAPAAPVT